uniref:Uncharacterized protein n=1 Tax=Arundo donax TaxID=35708 RepID=A0A0A8ZWP9_ARUDO
MPSPSRKNLLKPQPSA